jgi:hypothetical protein
MSQAKKRKIDVIGKTATISFDHITPAEYIRIDQLAVLTVYDTGLPFRFFEYSAIKRFLEVLRPVYKPSSAEALSKKMLNKAYTTVKEEVNKYLNTQTHLNVFFNETSNMAFNRVINIAITIKITF